MTRFARRRPSPATVISLIALFVALGGTGYAVTSLPKNSVGSAQVINGSLQQGDLSGKAIDGLEGDRGARGPAGAQGPPGAQGSAGAQGAAGANGTNGAHGATGPQGPSGPQGATGPAGPTDLSQFGRIYLAGFGEVTGVPAISSQSDPYTTVASAEITIGGTSKQWVLVQGTLSWQSHLGNGTCPCNGFARVREHGTDSVSPRFVSSVDQRPEFGQLTAPWVFLAAPGTHTYDLEFQWGSATFSGTALVADPVISAISIPFTSFGTPPG